MNSAQEDDSMLRFEWSVRALAQDAEGQHKLFPEFVCVADELALDFEEYYRKIDDLSGDFSEQQARAIAALDKKLETMSGPERAWLWTDKALAQAPEWQEVRHLAQTVLTQMEWSAVPPPSERAIYVTPPW